MNPDPYAKSPKNTLLWVGGAALVFLVGLISFGAGSGWFGLMGKRETGLDQTGKPQASLVIPGQPAPSLQKPAEPAPTLPKQAIRMPDDVYAWLKHLEETERRRKNLSNQQSGTIAVQMAYMQLGAGKQVLEGLLSGDPDALENKEPMREMAGTAEKMRGEWRQLMDFFRSVPPPQECVGAYTSYGETLGETSAMILEVLDAVVQAQESPDAAIAALNGMKGDSSTRIGRPALETDRLVQGICDKYETRKWFSIAADFGAGALGQTGSLPGMGAGN